MFNIPRDYNNENQIGFLNAAFEYLRAIIVISQEQQMIKNYDGFQLLMELMTESNIPEVSILALKLINV